MIIATQLAELIHSFFTKIHNKTKEQQLTLTVSCSLGTG